MNAARWMAALILGSASLALAGASPQFAVDPLMARGPAAAPVTIVEFSDYQ
jgi:hypothetical protein